MRDEIAREVGVGAVREQQGAAGCGDPAPLVGAREIVRDQLEALFVGAVPDQMAMVRDERLEIGE